MIAGATIIAGASWEWWAGFHAVVAALLLTEWLLFGRPQAKHTQTFAWLGTSALVLAARWINMPITLSLAVMGAILGCLRGVGSQRSAVSGYNSNGDGRFHREEDSPDYLISATSGRAGVEFTHAQNASISCWFGAEPGCIGR